MSTESTMVLSDKTAREIFEEIRANPARKRFGFGERIAIINVDPQKSYTRPDLFKTAYVTDPHQMEHINNISKAARAKGLPVIWTHVAYMETAADAGVWGTRTDTPDSLQNIKYGSKRTEFDDRLDIDRSIPNVCRVPFLKRRLILFSHGIKLTRLLSQAGPHRDAFAPPPWIACLTDIVLSYRLNA